MQAVVIKTLKTGSKSIYGEVLQRGLGTITLAITDKHGSKSIKRFKEENYVVRIIEE